MKAFAAHFSFDFRTGIRDKTQLLMNYFFPLGLYVMFGVMFSSLNPAFAETIIPTMIIIAIMSSTILSLPNPLVAAREAGVFRSYRINGVPAASILTVPALTTVTHMLLVTVIITITAPLLFNAPLPANWGYFILFFVLAALAHAGLGMLISVISSSVRSVVLWSQLIFLPSMLVGGLMIPSNTLPESLSKIGSLLPTTYAMNIYNGLAGGKAVGSEPFYSVLILLAGGLISFGLATYLFSWDNKNVARKAHPALAILALLPYVVGAVLF